MRTIVVGYDATPGARKALERAAAITRAFSAKLVVVSVEEFAPMATPTSMGAAGLEAGPTFQSYVPQPSAEDYWKGRHDDVRSVLDGYDIDYEFAPVLGRPAWEITHVADERDADLIVVGTREPGLVDRLLGGSTSGSIAKRAHRDVLIVHPTHGDAHEQ